MKFWDSSAILPLLVEEPTSKGIRKIFDEDDEVAIWWGSDVECISALARKEREAKLTPAQFALAEKNLNDFIENSIIITPSSELKKFARRLLRTHALRAADALQLAAAMVLAGDDVSELTMITFDERLKVSAQREGIQSIPI